MILLKPEIKVILLNITNKCNLQCTHCYVSSSPAEPIGLPIRAFIPVIEWINKNCPSISLAISGGEPLIRMDDVGALLSLIGKNIQPLILTNGHFFNKKFLKIIAPYKPRIRVSIDGPNALTNDNIRGKNSFYKTYKGIENLMASGYPEGNIEISCSIPPDNLNLVPEVLNMAHKLYIKKVKFEPISKTGRAAKNWDTDYTSTGKDLDHVKFSNFFDKFSTSQWISKPVSDRVHIWPTVYANGDVYSHVYYNSIDKSLTYLGNIASEEIGAIFDSEKIHSAFASRLILSFKNGRPGITPIIFERVNHG